MTRLLASLLLCSVLASPMLLAQQPPESYNTTLYGHLNPEPPDPNERYSAMTGYAAPNGREYALLGGWTGTHIVDVTEQPIKEVAFIPGPVNGWREMKAYNGYAYVVSEGGGGMQIIDLSKLPDSARLVTSDTSIFHAAHTITQNGHYLYVNGSRADARANGGTLIVDITDPIHPKYAGVYSAHYVHDCQVRNDTMYAAEIYDGRLEIIYLGQPDSAGIFTPVALTTIEYPGGGTHNSDLTTDGSYVMTTDEIGITQKTLKFWDVRNIGNISKVADFTMVPGEIVHNVHTRGSHAFVAWYSAGTRIIDISNPLDPAEVGYYDTYPGAANDYVGNWETYPYLPSGKIMASDMQTGLYVFTFNNAARGNVHGMIRDAATHQPIPGAEITITKFGRFVTADAQGNYSYSAAVDTLDFTAGASNYTNGAGSLILTAAGNEENIDLTSVSSSVPTDAAGSGSNAARAIVHPNPFSGAATLDLSLAAPQHNARLDLYNALGQQVRSIYAGSLSAGTRSFVINGAGLAAGRYMWHLTLDNGSVLTGAASLVR